jgi:Carboxypeptidase regulatory-like domain
MRVVTVASAPRALLLQEAPAGATSLRFASTGLTDGTRLLIRDGARTELVRLGAPGGTDPQSRPIRRPLRFAHEAGAGLHDLTLATSPVSTLRDPANQPASTLTLDGRAALDSGELAEGVVVHLDAGPAVELARLGPVPAPPGVTVPIAPALQGIHAVGAALRRVTDRADAGVLHLAATAGGAEVVVSGEQAARLHPGDVVGLGPPGGTAYHQVTANSPVTGGVVRSAETLVQIGGLITDRDRPPNPVAGASVLLVELRLAATTAADGRFVFTNLNPSPDPLTLRVTAAGYVQGEKKVRVPSQGRDEYHLPLSAT